MPFNSRWPLKKRGCTTLSATHPAASAPKKLNMPFPLSLAAFIAYPELDGLSDALVTAVMLGHMSTCKCVFSISGLSGLKNAGARTARPYIRHSGTTVRLGLPAHRSHPRVSARTRDAGRAQRVGKYTGHAIQAESTKTRHFCRGILEQAIRHARPSHARSFPSPPAPAFLVPGVHGTSTPPDQCCSRLWDIGEVREAICHGLADRALCGWD